MSRELKPSIIVITGVTRGLGRAMVDEFVRIGHTVLGCARTKNGIEELTRLYPSQDFETVDVAADEQVKAWAQRLLIDYGPPDFVLNNAAVINVKRALWEVGDREFSDAIDVNIKGVANVIRHFVPAMISRKHGVIVNFSSRWGKNVEEKMAPYCATKWAGLAITRALARELKPDGITVVALNPGIVQTGMFQKYLGDRSGVDTSGYLTAQEWSRIAVPCILRLCLKDSGKLRKVISPLR